MSTLTIELPESLKKSIEALAAKESYSVSQFLASAAGEKLAVVLTMDYMRREDLRNIWPPSRQLRHRRMTGFDPSLLAHGQHRHAPRPHPDFAPAKEQILNDPEANALTHRQYRDHWAVPKNL